MAGVYENCLCNLAATRSRNSHGGFFFERNKQFLSHCYVDINGHNFQLSCSRDWKLGLDLAPLHQRAWVLQERFLSPRVLYFSYDQLFWECAQLVACETFPSGPFQIERFSRSEPMYRSFKHLTVSCKHDILQGPLCKATAFWGDIIDQYSTFDLRLDFRNRQIDSIIWISQASPEFTQG